jgi:hypothetical protein
LSVDSLINSFPTSFLVYRAVITSGTYGEVVRTDALSATVIGFIQPNSGTGVEIKGRLATRIDCNIYFLASEDIRIDDELYTDPSGSPLTYAVWKVSGIRRAGNLTSGELSHLIVTASIINPARLVPA